MRIAVIGGAGSGKSHVANYLKDNYGAMLLEADKAAHRLYEQGADGYKAIVKMFGSDILDDSFNIDRKKLAGILFSDPDLLKKVDDIIHPMVYRDVYRKMEENPDRLIVYEAAIMPDDPDRFDRILYIKTDPDIRRKRLMDTRGYTSERVDEIYVSQASDDEYEEMADLVITNNGTFSELEEKTDAVMHDLSTKTTE